MFSGLRPSDSRMGPVLLRPHPVSSLLQQDFSRFSQVFPRLYPMFPGPYPVFLAFPPSRHMGCFGDRPGVRQQRTRLIKSNMGNSRGGGAFWLLTDDC